MSTNDCIRCEITDLLLGKNESWDNLSYKISQNLGVGLSDVEVVDYFFDPMPENSWDGAHDQGHEGEVYMVFKYQGRFFRVTGTSDSYGCLYWSHGVKEVFPTKVIKTVYEYSEKSV